MSETLLLSKPTTRLSVEDLARKALSASPIHSHRLVQVERQGDSLYLSGRVESFYYKQLAQEAVRTLCCGLLLVNEIDVA